MFYNKAGFVVLINCILLLNFRPTYTYTQISAGKTEEADSGGPKIYKALNFDLLFPRSFNSSENVIPTTPETIPSPTKTATSAVGQPHYPLPQSNQPTYTAAVAVDKRREPTIFVTPASTPLAATSNEAGINNDTQQNSNSNKNNDAQVVTQNAINMPEQQQQQQQLSDNYKAEKEPQQNYATGRAVDYHTSYPFGQVITPLIKNVPRPVYRKPVLSYSTFPTQSSLSLSAEKLAASSNVGKIIYPQAVYQKKPPSQAEFDKLHGKGKFSDRFSPSEGVASHAFKSNNDNSHKHHNHAPSYKPVEKTPSASNVVSSYVTSSNLYAFPPNNINYPIQNTEVTSPSSSLNSYSWPASGSLKNTKYNFNAVSSNNNPYQYNGPISGDYLPPSNGVVDSAGNMEDVKTIDGAGEGDLNNGAGDDLVGVLPASAMDQLNGASDGNMAGDMDGNMTAAMDSQDDKTPDENIYDTEKEYPTPPPGWLKEHPESAQDQPHPHDDHHPRQPDIEYDHDHDYHQSDIFAHDHDLANFHHSYPSYPIYHHHPTIIYDHPHHVEVPPPPPPPTTTEAPPPEPPPEPRVKKYSYFYIGRKLWYIPLYFTVWFSFYVLWLILKSIARHKVNLPNHYVSRRSVENYDLSKHQQEIINQLAASVFDKIDKFKRKYINSK